jgi:hypothetical protein
MGGRGMEGSRGARAWEFWEGPWSVDNVGGPFGPQRTRSVH